MAYKRFVKAGGWIYVITLGSALLLLTLAQFYRSNVRELARLSPAATQPTAASDAAVDFGPPTTFLDGAVDLGQGKYIKYVVRDGKTYAGVVFPPHIASAGAEQKKPGVYRDTARMHLADWDKEHKWLDVGREEKGGCIVYMFRALTPEEEQAASEAAKEMSRPLVP